MEPRLILLSQMGLSLLVYVLLMRIYIFPRLATWELHSALLPLTFVHCFRTLGLTAMVPGVVTPRVAQSTWAHHVALGDITTVLLAICAVLALHRKHKSALALVWTFNVIGSLDICNAGYNAIRDQIITGLGAQWFVVAYCVPALIVTHGAIFVLLLRKQPQAPS